MKRFFKVPIMLGLLVVAWGLVMVLRGLYRPYPEKLTVQLEAPKIQLRSEEVQLVVFLDPTNLEVSQPKYKTLELPQDNEQRLVRILSVLRDNLDGLWPEPLPLPTVFLHEQSVVLHFVLESPIDVSVGAEQRLYNSIVQTLKENAAPQVRILVNDQSETFLGHIALANYLE
jgi:hypothetical protein